MKYEYPIMISLEGNLSNILSFTLRSNQKQLKQELRQEILKKLKVDIRELSMASTYKFNLDDETE
jgi:hypothetical protein